MAKFYFVILKHYNLYSYRILQYKISLCPNHSPKKSLGKKGITVCIIKQLISLET